MLDAYPHQIRFIYRDFPLTNLHPQAVPAAKAAQCAFGQGRYWEYHDALFERKADLSESLYTQIAERLGLDTNAFKECLSSDRDAGRVTADLDEGIRLGVRGTPTFFVNGIVLVGAQPLGAFQQVIDQELARLKSN